MKIHSRASRTPCVDFLRRAHGDSKLNFLLYSIRRSLSFGDDLLQRRQYPDRVEIIVVTNVGDAKKLAFHLRLSVGHDRAKLFAEAFADDVGICAGGRGNGGERSRWRTGRE